MTINHMLTGNWPAELRRSGLGASQQKPHVPSTGPVSKESTYPHAEYTLEATINAIASIEAPYTSCLRTWDPPWVSVRKPVVKGS